MTCQVIAGKPMTYPLIVSRGPHCIESLMWVAEIIVDLTFTINNMMACQFPRSKVSRYFCDGPSPSNQSLSSHNPNMVSVGM
jgi:hypothetical protein